LRFAAFRHGSKGPKCLADQLFAAAADEINIVTGETALMYSSAAGAVAAIKLLLGVMGWE
jgi:hypothetical protein